jgi:AraC-like DNA-binding protein
MLAYFIVSLRYYNLYKKMIVQNISYADWVLFKWIKTFLVAFLVMLIIKVLFQIADFVPEFQELRYKGAWGQYFLFGLIFCYVGVMGYFNEVNTKLPFETNILDNSIVVQAEGEDPKNNNDSLSIDDSVLEWKPKLENYLYEQKAYQNEELNLSQIAKDLKTNPNIISKTINQGFGVNFNDWVNEARVKAVQESLQKGAQQTQTLLSIAFDCGFNSKATFNRAFKKYTNRSPKEWIEENIS